MFWEKKLTENELKQLLDELAKRYYGKPYDELCARRKKIIDEYAKDELKGAQN